MVKKKRKKQKPQRPEEIFSAGPIRMARFGKNIVSKTEWEPGQFEAMQDLFCARYDEVVKEIDEAIAAAAQLVASLPPLPLLHRAWWSRARSMLNIDNEFDVGTEQIQAERMVDFVQSLIASTPPCDSQKDEVSDEDYAKVESLIERIFTAINAQYFVCATAKRKRADPSLDEALEEFHFRAQHYWTNVKVNQYPVHQIQALRELLNPQDAIISSLYGISSDELCNELEKIWHAQIFGISDAVAAMKEAHRNFQVAFERDMADGLIDPQVSPQLNFQSVIERHALDAENQRAAGLFMGYDLLDLQKVTSLPEKFLLDFSWEPGEDPDFFADGDFRGWPLRVWPTFKRPFLRTEGRYYCFDLASIFDHLYRQLEKKAFASDSITKQRWIDARKVVTEDLPFEYLQRILPSARSIKSAFYKLSEDGKASKRCEVDGLLIVDDHLFVIEVKSGAFTYTSPATDVQAHLNSLSSLVADPAKQGRRFLKYLNSAPEVALYDEANNEIARLRAADFRHVTICGVTLDPFTEMAAQAQHLHKIGVEVGSEPVWSMSIDDIRAYTDVFQNPFEFLHYVEQRKAAFDSSFLQLDDELDHLGLYLGHNQYPLHVEELVGAKVNTRIQFTGYRVELDKFFSARLEDPVAPNPLRQKMPAKLTEFLDFLHREQRPGSARVSSYLLDMAGDWRDELFGYVQACSEHDRARPGPLSTHGDVRVTLQPWSGPIDPTDLETLTTHVKAMLVLNSEPDRLLLCLNYDPSGTITDAKWQWINRCDISKAEMPLLEAEAELLRARRVAKASTNAKVGRNELCPCGSGKKYKRCCIDKH